MKTARIVATRHEHTLHGIVVGPLVLDKPPMAVVSPLESIVYGWWYQAGGYPVGREFGWRLVR